MTLALIHSALATAAWAMFILVAIAAAIAFREEAVYAWRHRGWRNEREDSEALYIEFYANTQGDNQ